MKMRNFLRFNRLYFSASVLFFLVEVFIALFVHDKIVRPYVGDFLVVILMYCVVKAFLNISIARACIAVLAFACFIECLQYANVLKLAGLEHVKLLNIVLGHSFDWADLVAYTAGIIVTYFVEKIRGADV